MILTLPFLVVTQVHPVWLNRKLQNLLCSLTILMESHMELCSEINGWSITQKNWFLAVKLRGPAWLVYTDLPEAKKHSYPELVRALQERFCPQGQVGLFRAQLRARGRRKEESLQQLASGIRKLVLKAYLDVCSEFWEETARDQFIEDLDLPDVRTQVGRAKPHIEVKHWLWL